MNEGGGFAQLTAAGRDDAGADWVLSCHDVAGSPYVLVNIQSVEAFEAVTKKLKAAQMINPENAILRIEH